ncbi:MAG: hypothetical protein K6E73_13140 [Bacteroidales bacterium]|nr:hypothetical protein [Bacteroidales bacterium]
MKISKIIGIVIVAISMCANFTSCKDEEEVSKDISMSVSELSSKLVGTWSEVGTENGKVFQESLEFKSDGTYTWRVIGAVARQSKSGKWKFVNGNGRWINLKGYGDYAPDGYSFDFDMTFEDSSKKSNKIFISENFRCVFITEFGTYRFLFKK